jgi:hypothetical protein
MNILKLLGYLLGFAFLGVFMVNAMIEFYSGDRAFIGFLRVSAHLWSLFAFTLVYFFLFSRKARQEFLNSLKARIRERKEKCRPPSL